MTTITPSALALLRRQHGVATRQQLLDCELTKSNIETLRRAGTLDDVLRGVYHVPITELSDSARGTAVCLAHPDVALAGPTAGRYWGFRSMPNDHRVHVIAPPMSHPTTVTWVVPYRTDAIHPDDVIELRDGRRITTRARTALDLSRSLGTTSLLSVVEQAVHDGRLTSDHLRSTAVDWLSPQRRWLRDFLLTVDRRLAGGAAESHPETVLGDALHSSGLRGLQRQFIVDLPGYGPARFDLAFPALRWAIEVDVFPTHRETAGRVSDAVRDDAARAIGWSTTRLGPACFGANLAATVIDLVRQHDDLRANRAA